MSIWSESKGMLLRKSFNLEPWRMVESQHISSSRDLVDSREEHDILESLLDHSKPNVINNKHYLIFTPFRYPPLKYGSRFGNTYEPSIWYGSLNFQTVLAEVAFYRLKFFDDTSADLEYIDIPMTAFKAYIKTINGIDLTSSHFEKYQDKISDKISYEHSQQLGSEMRESNIDAFIFTSARDKALGKNLGVFTQDVFEMKHDQYITNMQNWRCIASKNNIEFMRNDIICRKHHEFSKEEFQ